MPETMQDFNPNPPVYSVSEISGAIKRVLEDHFGVVRLRGEVSGWKGPASSGHAYFSIKDEKSVINAICWKGTLPKLAQKPEEGLEVIATGRITSYNGKYQIIVEHIEPAGVGALMALLEKRRKQLEAEGLFDVGRKKPLPFLPSVVGVITSPTGAVIRDILHRIGDRFPVHVLVWGVPVQGEGAAEKIAEAIEGFNNLPVGIPRPDVIIVARGGGSIEDLWAFNEEIVVRAAAASAIPLISAVGHETDTTLIDFASDMRAPTPSAAAEMAVPVRDALTQGVREFDVRLIGAMQRVITQKQEQLTGLVRGLPRPAQLLETASQRLDDWAERLGAAPLAMVIRKQQQLVVIAAGLRPQALLNEIKMREQKLSHYAAQLESLNYKSVLARGFALVKDAHGKLVTSVAQAKGELSITFKDGETKVKA